MTEEERKARHRETCRRYRQAHKDKCRTYAEAYRAAHPNRSEYRRVYMIAYLKRYYAENKAQLLAQQTAHRNANIEQARERARLSAKANYAANPEAYRARVQKYMSTEKGQTQYATRYARTAAHRAARTRKWKIDNRPRLNAVNAARNATKRRATPPWADMEAIAEVYRMAAQLTQQTGIQHDVDHIVPIKGRTVCGLHVSANLQVLTHIDNVRKGNRFSPHITQPRQPFDEA